MKNIIFKKYEVLSEDNRGTITQLLDISGRNIKAILKIYSKKDAIRGNHYHKKDIHFTYLLKGNFRYVEKSTQRPKAKLVSRIINPGEMVVSHPNTIHAMKFLQDSEMIVFTTESRKQKDYERDTVRVKLI